MHHRSLGGLLGEPAGRFRTATAHAIVVPHQAACSNPGCQYVHRMAALVSGIEPLRVEGDLFLIDEAALATIDRLETGGAGAAGPYTRSRLVVVSPTGERLEAEAYCARDPTQWRRLVTLGRADALVEYPRDLAGGVGLKGCCLRAPGHPPPHDVIDPLAATGSHSP